MRHKRWNRLALVVSVVVVAAAKAQAQVYSSAPPPPIHSSIDANGVDLISGSMNLSGGRIALGGTGSGGLALSYVNTNSSNPGAPFGTINSDGTTVLVSIGGSTEKFTLSGGVYNPAQGQGSTLSYSSNDRIYTHVAADGTVAIFSNATRSLIPRKANEGNITSITKPNGEKLKFTYKLWNFCGGYAYGNCAVVVLVARPIAIVSNYGYHLHFNYSSYETTANTSVSPKSATIINAAVDYCDPEADLCPAFSRAWPSVSWSSNSSATASDLLGRTSSWTGGVLTRPSGAIVSQVSTGSTSFTVYNGVGTWSYSYSDSGTTRTMRVLDPLTHQRVVVSDQTSFRIISDTDALSHATNYTYDSYGRLTRVRQQEGDYVDYVYDSRGNVKTVTRVAKSGSGLANIVTKADYDLICNNPKTCNKPNFTVDERENRTDYTYDPLHGGVLTVTKAAPAAGAVQPQTRTYYSQYSAWIKDSSGAMVPQSPIWLPNLVSQCASLGPATATTASPCAGTADEVKTTIAYQPGSASLASNLRPITTTTGSGDGILSAVTTMTYDPYGNLETVDGPLPGAADTRRVYYDAVGRVVGEIDPDPDGTGPLRYRATKMKYHPDGQVTLVETGTATDQSATGMETFAAKAFTRYSYDPASGKLTKTEAGQP